MTLTQKIPSEVETKLQTIRIKMLELAKRAGSTQTKYTRREDNGTQVYTGNYTGGKLDRNLDFLLICLIKQLQNEDTAY